MKIHLYQEDLPENYNVGNSIAIDTEAMGLNTQRDRLCLIQLSTGDGNADIIQIAAGQTAAPYLKTICENSNILKIFHFGRFDIALLKRALGIDVNHVYCTKIASRFARTYTDQHGLKMLCRELLNLDIEKQQQSSDWGKRNLTEEQLHYAASDVIHLHALKEKLDEMLIREGRKRLAEECFKFLPTRVDIDLHGWQGKDIFAH